MHCGQKSGRCSQRIPRPSTSQTMTKMGQSPLFSLQGLQEHRLKGCVGCCLLTRHWKARVFMPTARYFIVHDQVQDEWHIKYGNEEYGPYKSQDEAMVFAIDAARNLGA